MTIARASWIVCLATMSAIAALCLLTACGREQSAASASPAAAPVTQEEQLRTGDKVYERHCAQCHHAGEGGPTAPPLKNSPVLLAEPAATYRAILQGQRNQSIVDGKKFSGIMPAMEYLSDEEVAAVTAYLRERFGGKSDLLDPAEVAKLRRD